MVRIHAAMLATLLAWAPVAIAQDAERPFNESRDAQERLKRDVEARFTVLPVQGGFLFQPRRGNPDVRSVEFRDGTIAVDGDPVTGTELRRRLRDDEADLMIRLSYLTPSERTALFGSPAPPQLPPDVRPEPPAAPEPPVLPRGGRRSGDRVRFGGNVRVETNEQVNGDVVAIGGRVYVDGQVRGDVVAIGGGVELGPNADIRNDVTVIGGLLKRDAAARIGGDLNEIAVGDGDAMRWLAPFSNGFFFTPFFGSFFAFASTVARFAVLCILASLVLMLGKEHVEQVGVRAAAEPVKSGMVGLLIQLLFVPVLIVTIVVMVVTIIGIPLLALIPFAIIALAVFFLVGFTAVTYDVGRLAAVRLGWQNPNAYMIATAGIAIVLSPVLLSRVVGFGGPFLLPFAFALLILGFIVEYAAWTVGLGALALLRFERRRAA